MCFKWGAHPLYSRGHYIQDTKFIDEYFKLASQFYQTDEKSDLDNFFSKYISGPSCHADYLELIGMKRLLGLQEY